MLSCFPDTAPLPRLRERTFTGPSNAVGGRVPLGLLAVVLVTLWQHTEVCAQRVFTLPVDLLTHDTLNQWLAANASPHSQRCCSPLLAISWTVCCFPDTSSGQPYRNYNTLFNGYTRAPSLAELCPVVVSQHRVSTCWGPCWRSGMSSL